MQHPVPTAAAPATLTDWMRSRFKSVLDSIGGFAGQLGFSPNAITLLGLAGALFGALLLALGSIRVGGLVILLSGALDGLDGALARLQGKTSKFGAFLDSTCDRWSELFLFGGLTVYFAVDADGFGVVLTFAAAVGSVMVSYVKARAEGLGLECKVGLLTRMERYLVLCPALLLDLPLWGVGLVALLGNFTALQRMWHVRNQTRAGS
jgi:CDP-diacylglycerol--glycerol-3-phosphate 3-phosphatidyltransferase